MERGKQASVENAEPPRWQVPRQTSYNNALAGIRYVAHARRFDHHQR